MSREDVIGVLHPESFYTTAGITRAIGVGPHQITEWIKHRKIEPVDCGRGYGFFGHQVLAVLVANSKSKAKAS